MQTNKEQQDKEKQQAKQAAADYASLMVESGMRVGLGSGSTARLFIEALGRRCRNEGLKITAIASSIASYNLAKKEMIPLENEEVIQELDLSVDGADQVDDEGRLIKGAGGAMMRERLIASMAKKYVIMVDESKLVAWLGYIALPIEVLPFGCGATLAKIEREGFKGRFRKNDQGQLFTSDNGNYIIDLYLNQRLGDPSILERRFRKIAGVLDCGFFLGYNPCVVVGSSDGEKSRSWVIRRQPT